MGSGIGGDQAIKGGAFPPPAGLALGPPPPGIVPLAGGGLPSAVTYASYAEAMAASAAMLHHPVAALGPPGAPFVPGMEARLPLVAGYPHVLGPPPPQQQQQRSPAGIGVGVGVVPTTGSTPGTYGPGYQQVGFSNPQPRLPGAGAGRGRGRGGARRYDQTQFIVDLERVRAGLETRKTLMIRNIPNKYTQRMLLTAVDELFGGEYDFFYLPIDFKNKCNVGYAFINFINYQYVDCIYCTLGALSASICLCIWFSLSF